MGGERLRSVARMAIELSLMQQSGGEECIHNTCTYMYYCIIIILEKCRALWGEPEQAVFILKEIPVITV